MKKAPHEAFAHRLQLVRDEFGWNMSDIARRAMVTPQAVQQWAKGESAPRGERLKRLAAAAGKPEHWFFIPPGAEDGDVLAPSAPRQLDEKETTLLALFNQMPEAEKLRLIVHAKTTLKELDLLKDDVLNIIQSIQK
ncbi:helix-turn-helix domain-containing protein [Enterobacteriaceae bacterium H4N4]|uniref:Helix-turn-helix domain-containing protein n=1 Tax=Silvania confinis TaxID=2926470 RepID=A0A9J6QL07_9ENTR|nr:helix-turn-helix domain-containing protein [Silvania confinis]MCU6669954.1 helix-turn-helix domain-containing protein [Silvania confinis]